MKTNFKISQFSIFLLRSEYAIQVKIWKWLKLLNSVLLFKKILVNHVYIPISSSWLTFTVLQWLKTNFKISQFSSFLLRSGYAILVKIWKWLKLLNSIPFNKKTPVNHLYIWIWSFWLTFTALQWMQTNFKISQFSRFLLRSRYVILFKIWKWLILLNSVPFIFTFEFDNFDWLSQLDNEWRQTLNLVNLKISAKVRVCDTGQNFKNY